MNDLILYLGVVLIGYAFGAFLRHKRQQAPWAAKTLNVVVAILVFTMGLRIGANDDVVSNLDYIGLYAFVFTVATMIFTTAGLFIVRRALGLDRYAMPRTSPHPQTHHDASAQHDRRVPIDKTTIVIICAVAAGLAVGFALMRCATISFDSINEYAALVIRVGLCTLLMLIGLDLGIEGTVIGSMRRAGFRVLAMPFAVIASTLAASALISFVLPVSLNESLAIGSGFGWYSLAPGIIMDQGYITAGAISFMHNVMRELFAVITIPFVAQHVGFIESCGLPGAASMDVCLPIIGRSTNGITAVYAFANGLALSVAVPILVPLFC